jgi:NDP-sugar pyrophosphorylase family protein
MDPANMDVVILCGGMGTRLSSIVNDRPKPMAQIDNRPFLDILIEYISGFGFKRFILCTGYMVEAIEQYYKKRGGDLEIVISNEDKPLGTAGAVKNAENLISSNFFLVVNGDSFCPADLSGFLGFHLEKQALISMVVIESEQAAESGTVRLDQMQRITGFVEKIAGIGNVYINAGIYLFHKDVLSEIKRGQKCSLEYDLFPKLITADCFGYISDQKLIDIGTPRKLKNARGFFKNRKLLI